MTNEDLARRGFATGTDVYHRARPAYRPEVLAYLAGAAGLAPDAHVLDLAAGTGRMTRELVALGTDVTAVEPAPAMRETFVAELPDVRLVDGTAEQIPAGDAQFDAVVVAQAFHWFDAPAALREIARVLRPGGALAVLWNERDQSEPWAAELGAATRWEGFRPYLVDRDLGTDLDANGRYEPAVRRDFPWTDRLTHEQLLERVGTFSYVVAMPEHERTALFGRVRAYLPKLPDPVELPYVTGTLVSRKRGR
ncbi:MAG: class I SAM-dependent methyltransferase [Streptomycetaceae bacterium]|jgi:SAM-dependent methyltransferase|nr:class I SAM-dependent methyltransferase [Streptomycetaceae bacterium]NUS58186.1 class I SAM-dependent methyltransferase [Streptomycetaceae bacterium]